MRRMAINSAAQILSCIKANRKIQYFLYKEYPPSSHHPKYVVALLLDQDGTMFLALNLVLLQVNYLLLQQLELEL